MRYLFRHGYSTRYGIHTLHTLATASHPKVAGNPPSLLSTVPFPRDPDFVSRDNLLDQIRDKNLVLGSRIALVGLGGVGLL